MKIVYAFLLMAILLVMIGCSSGLQVIQKPNAGDRLAIIMFEDCNGAIDCPGSGKMVTDIYSEVLGAPVMMFESDAKGFDVLLVGKIEQFNKAIPMAGNINLVKVDLMVKRVSDSSILIRQSKQVMGSNLFSSTKGLSQDLANSLKESMY